MKAVLFDFDGVIANTLQYHVEGWNRAYRKFGYDVTVNEEDISRQEGKGADQIVAGIAAMYELKLTKSQLEEITAEKRNVYKQITHASVYPETQAFLNELKQRSVRIALVTGSVIPSLLQVVDQEFLDQFEVIITQYDVVNTKPDPEPFLKAAERLKLQPEQCVVIENAPMGIKAAKAAGMYCVALRTTIHDDTWLMEADLIVDHADKIDLDLLLTIGN
ncbi:HAD family phosphatase [candidate division KSB1 bacterium]|nr:HAD family phosphatase [candidate division KSB1 bacterium]